MIISHIINGASVASLDLWPKPAAQKSAGSSGRSIVVWTMWLSCTTFLWAFLLSCLGFKIPWSATCSSLKGSSGFAWLVCVSLVGSLQNSHPGRQWCAPSWDFQPWEGPGGWFGLLQGPSHRVFAEFRLELCRLHPLCVILLAPAENERQLLLSGGKLFFWKFHCRQNMKQWSLLWQWKKPLVFSG